ncbi:hypothetical protein EDC01DRAFT_721097 [Geopyxis carbonaria]|nr:hypothetical protein EDC01DRAFT_721097 [Geopyxis carbonaria]
MSAPAPASAAGPPGPARPQTWLITAALSKFGHAIAQRALARGDNVALGVSRRALQSPAARDTLEALAAGAAPGCSVVVELDIEQACTTQSAIAQLLSAFGSLDILLLPPPARTVVAALEDMAPAAVTAGFAASYFGPLNILRAALPTLRRQQYTRGGGHIVVISSLTGAMGTPGLAIRTAGDHALEGLLDALAYEVAPFGVRVSVVQPAVEVGAFAAADEVVVDEAGLEEYRGGQIGGVREMAKAVGGMGGEGVDEAVGVVMAIAGVENPPGRITVGEEAVEMVKERLKTLSEELEEYLEASLGADIVVIGKEKEKSAAGRGATVDEAE